MRYYAYELLNKDYEKLFFRQAAISSLQLSLFYSYSAGQLIPNKISVCKPIFITHFIITVIQLLYKTLPKNTLLDTIQGKLVYAAQELADASNYNLGEVLPSTQRLYSTLSLLYKRVVLSTPILSILQLKQLYLDLTLSPILLEEQLISPTLFIDSIS